MFGKQKHVKKLESAIEVVNDCFDALCNAETRDGVFGDLFYAWKYIGDAMRVYYRGIKRIDKKLSSTSNESKLENRIKQLEQLMKK